MLLYCSCFLKLFYFSGSPLFCQCTHYFCLQVASLLMHKTNIFPFPGSPLCSAMPRQLWCALGVPQSFASPLEAVQGTFQVPSICCLMIAKALLCFCLSFVEISASKRAEISQTYGGAVFCDTAPHCKAGTNFLTNYILFCYPILF